MLKYTLICNLEKKTSKGTSSCLQYYVFTSSHNVHQTVMVPFYLCLLSGCSVFATLQAAENVPAPVCFGVRSVHNIQQ